MDKKLPKVFANPQEKTFTNNKRVYYSKDNSSLESTIKYQDTSNELLRSTEEKNIYQKLNEIFTSERYVYKADVEIRTKEGKLNTKLIGQNRTHVITMDNQLIPITDIEDIKFSE